MRRVSPLPAIASSIALSLGLVGPAAALDQLPTEAAYIELDVSYTGYLGGYIEQYAQFTIFCENLGQRVLDVYLTDNYGVSQPVGPFPADVRCNAWVSYWPDPGENGQWSEDVAWVPGNSVVLAAGMNTIGVTLELSYNGDWPPAGDSWSEHEFAQMTIDRVYLNKYGGIMVEGRAWCDASDLVDDGLWVYDQDGSIIAGTNWQATQYAGRKAAITARYDSGIGFVCFDREDQSKVGQWGTYFAYPSGDPMWVYAVTGKFGSGTIHVDALATTGLFVVTQNWLPDSTFMGAPYEAGCADGNGDGFCSAEHFWFGPTQMDLKPIRVR